MNSSAPVLKGGTAEQQEWINYAWKLYPNMDMILTFDVESGWAGPSIQSGVYLYYDGEKNQICKGKSYMGNDCIRESSFGFCQFNLKYQSDIVNHDRFHNAYWQINKCVQRYKDYESRNIIGLRFFGYNYRKARVTRYIK